MLINSLSEIFSVFSLLPLLTSLVDHNRIYEISILGPLLKAYRFVNPEIILITTTIIFLLAIFISAFLRIIGLWLNNKISAFIGSDIGLKVFRNSIFQSYEVQINRNSSEVLNASYSQVNKVVQAINAFLQLLTSFFIASGLIISLLIINFYMSLFVFIVLGFLYYSLSKLLKKKILNNSNDILIANQSILKLLREAFSSIKETIISGRQNYFTNQYKLIDRRNRLTNAQNLFFTSFPRYFFEAIGIFVISLVMFYIKFYSVESYLVVPLIGALALGVQRTLPALQQIYSSWSVIRSNNASLKLVLNLLDQQYDLDSIENNEIKNILRQDLIVFKNISYKYLSSNVYSIQGVNLKIKSGEKIGIIGKTGSGKSTLVDILLGLLKPTDGELLIDGVNINNGKYRKRLRAWMRSIAYVPQNINLLDDTFKKNIAFGVPEDEIDYSLIKECAAQAQIASFIESKKNGYNTLVGEKGINLSGGQRQRVVIARALYSRSNIVILDEATSALDRETEKKIINSFFEIDRNNKTLIIISHKFDTLLNCDKIIELENGTIKDYGTPNSLINKR